MEEKLKALFDFQRFAQENALKALIHDTEARYAAYGPVPLSDDWLEVVAAAGDPTCSAETHPTVASTDDHNKAQR